MNGFVATTSPWLWIYAAGSYASALACLTFGVRLWRGGARKQGAIQVAIFLAFVVFFYALESFGQARIPFYNYSAAFWDAIPALPFRDIPALRYEFSGPIAACAALVEKEAPFVPLSVAVMEASLAYAAMWTARLLRAPALFQPFFAGLALLIVDAGLDPVVATSYGCDTPPAELMGGLGLWRWLVVEELGPDRFYIPLINYCLWFCAPLLLFCLVEIARKSFGWTGPIHTRGFSWPADRLVSRSLWAGIAAIGCGIVIALSPSLSQLNIMAQRALFHGTIVAVTIVFLLRLWKEGDRNHSIRWEFVAPPLFFIIFSDAYLLASGLFRRDPWLLLNATLYTAMGALYCLSPYERAVRRCRRLAAEIDAYLRIRYLSYSSLLILLGAASVTRKPPSPMLLGLVLVALGFNTVSFLVNDLIDLRVDRTQPRRRDDPQVRGAVRPWQSLILAISLVPILFCITAVLGGSERAHVTLGCALILMTLYNFFGKRFPVPPVTDFVQGAAWGALAVYGAELAGGETNWMTWLVAAYGAGFMFLINGIHGGLRDLENDRAHRQRTTAIYLGAEPDGRGEAISSRGVRIFGRVVHSMLMVILAGLLLRVFSEPATWLGWLALPTTLALAGWSWYLNHAVLAERQPNRDAKVTWHLCVALLPLLVGALPTVSPLMGVLVVMLFFGPLLFAWAGGLVWTPRRFEETVEEAA